MFCEFDEYNNGGGEPQPRILLDFYGALNIEAYLEANMKSTEKAWPHIYPQVADRREVEEFDPQEIDLPPSCAHILMTAIGSDLSRYSLIISYGALIMAETARAIAELQIKSEIPQDKSLARFFPNEATYFLTKENGLGIAYPFTLAIFDAQTSPRTHVWNNDALMKTLPSID